MGGGREFDRIRKIAAAIGADAANLGDDTATIPDGDGTLVISTDASVRGVHFQPEWLEPGEIGWRATASALSDLAASAARPAGVVSAIMLPAGSGEGLEVEISRGVVAAANAAGCQLLGGDISRSTELAVVITVVGRAAAPVARSGARVGDDVWVTGGLGGARAALVAWNAGRTPAAGARLAFAHPIPRIAAGEWLAAQGATALIDLSDGLAADAGHVAAASAVAIELELGLVPVHPSVHRESTAASESPFVFAATGGEDYELLATMPSSWRSAIESESWTGVALTRVGRVVAGSGVTCFLGGRRVDVGGFDHG